MRIDTEMIEEFKTAKPEYRQAATLGVVLEDWQTDHLGGEWRTEIECENGHILTGHHVKLRSDP